MWYQHDQHYDAPDKTKVPNWKLKLEILFHYQMCVHGGATKMSNHMQLTGLYLSLDLANGKVLYGQAYHNRTCYLAE